jgi:hypothetical protein
VRWQLALIDRFGERKPLDEGSVAATPARFTVTSLGDLAITLPTEAGLATVALWLEDEQGIVRSRNYINVLVRAEAAPLMETLPNGWAIRFAPGQFSHSTWPQPFTAPDGAKFSATGSGWVEYEVSLPAAINRSAVRQLRLRFEAAARAGMAKVDWPERTYGLNYPQTEADKKFPTTVQVTINDQVIGTSHLPDDPADARGVLSHHHAVDPGSYGYLTELTVEGAALQTLLAAAQPWRIRFTVPPEGATAGGISLFGETLGEYPMGPTVLLLR